jgi:hypothetical protein
MVLPLMIASRPDARRMARPSDSSNRIPFSLISLIPLGTELDGGLYSFLQPPYSDKFW